MIKVPRLTLYLILLLSFTLRFWNLQGLPVGFASDEVMNGYVGRYILENGFDLYGNRWPMLYFDHFGDYPNVIPMYLSGLFTYLFGINEFAVRFPIALVGSLTVLLIYMIGKWLWRSQIPALLAAFTLAVMPWHIILSRATAEGITASFVFLAGLLTFFSGVEKNNRKKIVSGWMLSFFTYLLYPGFRVFVPLALLPAVLLVQKTQKKLVTILTIILFITTFLISQTVWGKGRFDQTSLMSYGNVISGKSTGYGVGLGQNNILSAKIYSNKYVLTAREFLRQYASYFSPAFLTGEEVKPARYFAPEHGVVYWSLLLVALVVVAKQFVVPWDKKGLTALFQNGRQRFFWWLLWIIAVAPIPASLTMEDVPNIHRTVVIAPLLALVIGICGYLVSLIVITKQKLVLQVMLLAMLAETLFFWHYYSNLHSTVATAFRNDKQRTLANWIIDHRGEYKNVYAPSGEGLQIHYLFQTKNFSPVIAGSVKSGLKIDSIDNVVFPEVECSTQSKWADNPGESVFIDKNWRVDKPGFLEVGRIKRLDTMDAYRILAPIKPED